MITIDGSEGGGQILRTALALSIITQRPFKAVNIRASRPKAGLKAQHLTCINALKDFSKAKADGAFLGSKELLFIPGIFKGQNKEINIGTAGSITLLLQSILLPAFFAKQKSKLTIIGGSDVQWSPSMDYLKEILLPQLNRLGKTEVLIQKRGFYPKGQAKVIVTINPKYKLEGEEVVTEVRKLAKEVKLKEQGNLVLIRGVSYSSKELEERKVAERQTRGADLALSKLKCPIKIRQEYCSTESIGSGITLWAMFTQNKEELDLNNPIRIGSDILGEKNIRAEDLGRKTAERLVEEINSGCPVDRFLGDMIIPLIGILGGSFRTSRITNHTKTNIKVVEQFLNVEFKINENLITCIR
jgi:RNA 3'-phosphate cyclase